MILKINNHKTIAMKSKIIVIIALMITTFMSNAQSIFDKFEDMESVTSLVINQRMFSMIASIDIDVDDPEAEEYLDMVKKISSLKVFTTGNEKISKEMSLSMNKYIDSKKLDELMRIKDGGQTVKFYVKEGKDENHVKELLMYVTGLKEMSKDANVEINGKKRELETVLLTLTGDIDLRQISKMTNQMNIPGGDQLKKASESR